MAVCGNIEINPNMVKPAKKKMNTVKDKKEVKKYKPLLEKCENNSKRYSGTCGNIT